MRIAAKTAKRWLDPYRVTYIHTLSRCVNVDTMRRTTGACVRMRMKEACRAGRGAGLKSCDRTATSCALFCNATSKKRHVSQASASAGPPGCVFCHTSGRLRQRSRPLVRVQGPWRSLGRRWLHLLLHKPHLSALALT